VINGLLQEDLSLLKSSVKQIDNLKSEQEDLKFQIYDLIKRFDSDTSDSGCLYILVYDHAQDMVQSITLISQSALDHVANSLEPLQKSYGIQLSNLHNITEHYLNQLIDSISNKEFDKLDHLNKEKNIILREIEETLAGEIENIKHNSPSKRNSLLVISILLETKDLIAVAMRFIKLYNRMLSATDEYDNYFMSKVGK
jgi:hypothetical protein